MNANLRGKGRGIVIGYTINFIFRLLMEAKIGKITKIRGTIDQQYRINHKIFEPKFVPSNMVN